MEKGVPEYPILGVGGIVFLDDRVVLVKRGKEPGYRTWSIPGGTVRLGETMKGAVIREVYEETDLNVDTIGIVKIVDPIIRDDNNRILFHFVLVDFLCKYKSGKLRHNSDALDARAVPISELSGCGIPGVTLEVIDKALYLLKQRAN